MIVALCLLGMLCIGFMLRGYLDRLLVQELLRRNLPCDHGTEEERDERA